MDDQPRSIIRDACDLTALRSRGDGVKGMKFPILDQLDGKAKVSGMEPTVTVGQVYRTPWEPSGLFRVTEIEAQGTGFGATAFGYFVGDHPKGYKDGEWGRYYVKELVGREVIERDLSGYVTRENM